MVVGLSNTSFFIFVFLEYVVLGLKNILYYCL